MLKRKSIDTAKSANKNWTLWQNERERTEKREKTSYRKTEASKDIKETPSAASSESKEDRKGWRYKISTLKPPWHLKTHNILRTLKGDKIHKWSLMGKQTLHLLINSKTVSGPITTFARRVPSRQRIFLSHLPVFWKPRLQENSQYQSSAHACVISPWATFLWRTPEPGFRGLAMHWPTSRSLKRLMSPSILYR